MITKPQPKKYTISDDQLKNICGVLLHKGLPQAAIDLEETIRSQTLDAELHNANPFNRTCFGKFQACPCDDDCVASGNCKTYSNAMEENRNHSRKLTVAKILDSIKTHDDEICGSYGLWEMNSDECDSFDGNCTLCKVSKVIKTLELSQ
jgi:hypothetical protein